MQLRLIRLDGLDDHAQQVDSLYPVALRALGRSDEGEPVYADVFGKVVRTVVQVSATSPCKLGSDQSTVMAVEEAFDWTVGVVRELLFRYRQAADTYAPLPARESLPFVIWMNRVTYRLDGSVFEDPGMGMYIIGESGGAGETEHGDISPEQLRQLYATPWDSYVDVMFQRFNTFALEAREAMYIRGDYRATILNAATAAECLLDDFLGHALWWERSSPADAVPALVKPIVSRVKSEFPKRFGGTWLSQRSRNAVQDWHDNIVRYRDRVVHGGYQPTGQEARNAGEALSKLRRFLGQRVLDRRVQTQYPYLSLLLLGPDKLTLEGIDAKPLMQWYNDPAGYGERFDRWRAICRRLKIELFGSEVRPELDKCAVFAVVTRDDIAHYAVDVPFALAAKIRIPRLLPKERRRLELVQRTLGNRRLATLPFIDFGTKGREMISRKWRPAEDILPAYDYSRP
jgi:hypothetical protein